MKNCPMEISFSCDINMTFTFTAAGLAESVECTTLTFTFMGGRGFRFQGQERIQNFS